MVFPGKCVELTAYLDKYITYYSQVNSVVVTRFNDWTLLNASFDAHSQRRKRKLVKIMDRFPSTQKCPRQRILYLSRLLFT